MGDCTGARAEVLNEYEFGVGIVAGLGVLAWIVSLEVRFRKATNGRIMAEQAEKDAEITSDVRKLSPAERNMLSTVAAERYSKD